MYDELALDPRTISGLDRHALDRLRERIVVKLGGIQRSHDPPRLIEVVLGNTFDLLDSCLLIARGQLRRATEENDARQTLGNGVVDLASDTSSLIESPALTLGLCEQTPCRFAFRK